MKSSVPPLLRPWMPQRCRPIVLIGASGIARDAHLPAYRRAGFPVIAVFDLDIDRAQKLAHDFGIPRVLHSLEQVFCEPIDEVVFDVTVPGAVLPNVISTLPERCAVLMQKPMGEGIAAARQILEICRRKQLIAAVNFQLRYAPFVLAARSLIEQEKIGYLGDMEVRVTVSTPWHLWPALQQVPQFEILYHSIHYIDLFRSFLGEPCGLYARTFQGNRDERVGTSIILDFQDQIRANITTNHAHRFGLRHQESYIKWEGNVGALKAQMGLLMNYPKGETDYLECCRNSGGDVKQSYDWQSVPCDGSWFPDAFIGTMGSLQRYVEGSESKLSTHVEDAFNTMLVVDAAIRSSVNGVEPISRPPESL
jgi:predicted dehydrogenase